jgi:hypothetical protein
VLKPPTVHQELRVLRRILNVAVRKKPLPSNPCWGVEFPVAVKGFRTSDLQGTHADEEGPSGSGEQGRLDSSRYLFPSDNAVGYQTTFKTSWRLTLRRAKVFKKYSQMKWQMKREALQKLNRTANESAGVGGQVG